MKIKELKEFSRKLNAITENLGELQQTKSVPLGELLTADFFSTNTKFVSLDQLFESGDFRVESTEDLEAVPSEQLGAHIRANSSYADWSSMLGDAGSQWAVKKIGL